MASSSAEGTAGIVDVVSAGGCGEVGIVSFGLRERRIRAGLPAAMVWAGMSLVTTAPAPMIVWGPTVTPSRMVTFEPIQTSSPMVMPRAVWGCWKIG